MPALNTFEKQQFMNVETYRKTGVAVRTPVWFVEVNSVLCFTTETRSGKVKRLRRNPKVRVAPCKVNGELLGDWHNGTARFLSGDEILVVEKMFSRKYGLQKYWFDLLGRLQRRERLFIAIQLAGL